MPAAFRNTPNVPPEAADQSESVNPNLWPSGVPGFDLDQIGFEHYRRKMELRTKGRNRYLDEQPDRHRNVSAPATMLLAATRSTKRGFAVPVLWAQSTYRAAQWGRWRTVVGR
jgi:hypothetical protein